MGLSVVEKLRKYSRNSEERRFSQRKDRMELENRLSAIIRNSEAKLLAVIDLNR